MANISGVDGLTGVEDRQALDSALRSLAELQDMRSVVLLVLDIDHFKRINDGPGHIAGDDVLRGVGYLLQRLVGCYPNGRVFRYGGDEFVIILIGYTIGEAVGLATTIADTVKHLAVPNAPNALTVSIGISQSPPDPPTTLLDRADQALLQVKRTGRGRVEIFSIATTPQGTATRRLVLNPQLFGILDKTLRLAFVRTEQYHRAVEFIERHSELPLKCISVLGPTDLVLVHLADREFRFLADVQPLLDAAEGGDPHSLQYFEVSEIIKYHGYISTVPHNTPRHPDRTILTELTAFADGRDVHLIDDERFQELSRQGYALGIEGTDLRESEIEAYITVNMLGSRADILAPALFRQIINEELLADTHIVSIYEGRGVNVNMQYVIRTKSSPSYLFDFIEALHRRCHKKMLPRIQTSTFMVVRSKPLRLHRSLLIPALNADQKRIRDAVIIPLLEDGEQVEFLFANHEAHELLIAEVGRLDDAFSGLSVPSSALSAKEQISFRQRAIRAVVTADVRAIRNIFGDLIAVVEPALRDTATTSVRFHYPNLEDAVKDKIISQASAHKNLAGLTLGEVRDILRAFHRSAHAACKELPAVEFVEQLQPVIDIRNKLVHGEPVKPEEATRVLADFVQLLSLHAGSVFKNWK